MPESKILHLGDKCTREAKFSPALFQFVYTDTYLCGDKANPAVDHDFQRYSLSTTKTCTYWYHKKMPSVCKEYSTESLQIVYNFVIVWLADALTAFINRS